jgi:outer membrane biosynthesis protein TonB
MILATAEDRKRIAKSWGFSFGIMALLLITTAFVKLSRSIPPLEPMELFVEVNYGVDPVGSGNIQTFNKANESKVAENMRPEPEKAEVKAVAKPVPPTPKVTEVKKAPATKAVAKPPITSKVESPVVEKPAAETKKAPDAASSNTTTSATPAKAPEKPINQDALFSKSKGGASGSNGTSGTASGIGGNNNGDDASGVGDKGVKDGSLYAKNYKGSGGGGGSNVGYNLKGWKWRQAPQVNDKSDATGDIIFKIVVDKSGRVKNVITQSTTITDYAVVNQYRNAVRALTFISESANVPDESTGTITFRIRSK